MIDEAELKRMTRQERARLMRALAAVDMPRLTTTHGTRRRKVLILGAVVCCLALAAWTGLLASTLPGYYRAGDWRGAWVGFDVAEIVAFAVTAWLVDGGVLRAQVVPGLAGQGQDTGHELESADLR